jgi:2-haloacid dehalogenase
METNSQPASAQSSRTSPSGMRAYDSILFDLLTALLNSWRLWNDVAGSQESGFRWRRRYLELTYQCGAYRPYEEIIWEAARDTDVSPEKAGSLVSRWCDLEPWLETNEVLKELANRVPLGVVTNSSNVLAKIALSKIETSFVTVVTSEMAGYYKPRPEPYQMALRQLRTPPERTLFVAGSAADIPGASGVGMPVYWHNRANLKALAGGAQPIQVADSLWPLVDLV